ncbi:MAG: hypothetical protein ABSF98_14730 [Bryobacteraceae bacterium]|jgi:hypothetical protein
MFVCLPRPRLFVACFLILAYTPAQETPGEGSGTPQQGWRGRLQDAIDRAQGNHRLTPRHEGRRSVVFSGGLQHIGQESITIRLADGVLIDAALAKGGHVTVEEIVAHYTFGDRVEITCSPIDEIYDAESQRYRFLEVKNLRLLTPFSDEERSREIGCRAWRQAGNRLKDLPATSAPAQGEGNALRGPSVDYQNELEQARRVNLDYAANLPNFVADEIGRHYSGNDVGREWKYVQTVGSEVTFRGSSTSRQRVTRNGRPWGKPFEALPGFKWIGGFGAELKPLFDPECPTTLQFSGRMQMRGRSVLVYEFVAPPDGCFGDLYWKFRRFYPGESGRVFVEDPGGDVVHLEARATGFPGEFEMSGWEEEASWDRVRIGDVEHLLPVSASIVVRYAAGGAWKVDLEYRNHRHFEASSQVHFQ